jgi:hypothetical protein
MHSALRKAQRVFKKPEISGVSTLCALRLALCRSIHLDGKIALFLINLPILN